MKVDVDSLAQARAAMGGGSDLVVVVQAFEAPIAVLKVVTADQE